MTTGTFVLTYIIAMYEGDVKPFFPYISDTGTKPPESCIFGLFLNFSVFLTVGTMYVRYKLVETITGHTDTKVVRLNKAGFGIGLVSAFGLGLVANFQETSVEIVHLTGAFLVFAVGIIHAFIQTVLSYTMCPLFNGRYICKARLTFSCLALVFFIITTVSSVISRLKIEETTDKFNWKPDEAGYVAHLISTFGEWATALVFLFFFLTYVRDFMKIKLDIKSDLHVRHLDESLNHTEERTRLLA